MSEDQLDSLLAGLFSDVIPEPDGGPIPEELGRPSGEERVQVTLEPASKKATVVLPHELAPSGEQPLTTEPATSLTAKALPQRILIMHSDSNSARMLSDFFCKRGRHVWRAKNFTQARVILEQIRPELVIADWGPPDSVWQDMLLIIRQQLPDTRVVLTRRHPTP